MTMNKLMERAAEMNWEVKSYFMIKGGMAVVLVYRPGMSYSTHLWIDNGFYHGNYDMTEDEARGDYFKRVTKEMDRNNTPTTTCVICAEPMDEGYLVDDHYTYCSEEHLLEDISKEDAEDIDYCFWTTFID